MRIRQIDMWTSTNAYVENPLSYTPNAKSLLNPDMMCHNWKLPQNYSMVPPGTAVVSTVLTCVSLLSAFATVTHSLVIHCDYHVMCAL